MHAMAWDGTQVGVRPLVAGAPGEDCRGHRPPVTAAGWRSMVLTLAVMCCVTTATPRLGRTASVPAGNDDLLGKAEIPAACAHSSGQVQADARSASRPQASG